jgi:hypothetical protein
MTLEQIKNRYGNQATVLAAILRNKRILASLRDSVSDEMADSRLGMTACQIAQTGHCGKNKATADEVAMAQIVCPKGYYPKGEDEGFVALFGPQTGEKWDGKVRA